MKTLTLVAASALLVAGVTLPAHAASAEATDCTTTACVTKEITSWISWADGRWIDLDGGPAGYTWYQCVDLTNSYVQRVYGVRGWTSGNAIDWWDRYSSNATLKRLFVQKPASATPKTGWIAVYRYSTDQYGPAGHVAVVAEDGISTAKHHVWSWWYTSTIRVIHQNAPVEGMRTNQSWYPTAKLAGYLAPRLLEDLPAAKTVKGKTTSTLTTVKSKRSGRTVTVTGRATPARAVVTLSIRKGGAWKKLAQTTSSRTGAFTLKAKAVKKSSWRVRIAPLPTRTETTHTLTR